MATGNPSTMRSEKRSALRFSDLIVALISLPSDLGCRNNQWKIESIKVELERTRDSFLSIQEIELYRDYGSESPALYRINFLSKIKDQKKENFFFFFIDPSILTFSFKEVNETKFSSSVNEVDSVCLALQEVESSDSVRVAQIPVPVDSSVVEVLNSDSILCKNLYNDKTYVSMYKQSERNCS